MNSIKSKRTPLTFRQTELSKIKGETLKPLISLEAYQTFPKYK